MPPSRTVVDLEGGRVVVRMPPTRLQGGHAGFRAVRSVEPVGDNGAALTRPCSR
jgi:hypothetical protein